MEVLSGGASVMAVASLVLQLVDSVRQLFAQVTGSMSFVQADDCRCDFWESVQEAPTNISAIVSDLNLLSAVLGTLQHNEEIFGPQQVTVCHTEQHFSGLGG